MDKYSNELLNSILNSNFDKDLFLEISDYLVKKLDLSEYVEKIDFECLFKKNIEGIYDGSNISINIPKHNCEFILFYYKKIFNTLFHELRHAMQLKLIDKYNNYYKNLPISHIYTKEETNELAYIHAIGISYRLMDKNGNKYDKFHDLYPIEHEANFYGYLNSVEFLSNQVPEFSKHLYTKFEHHLLELLLRGYKIKLISLTVQSPYEQIADNDIKKSTKKILLGDNNLSSYERLVLGLPINKDLFFELYNICLSGSYPNDFKNYIKKI